MTTEPTLAGYTAELLAEFEAFERDLAKLTMRLDEIHVEASQIEGGKPLWDFRRQLQQAKDRIAGAWRNVQWAKEQFTDDPRGVAA